LGAEMVPVNPFHSREVASEVHERLGGTGLRTRITVDIDPPMIPRSAHLRRVQECGCLGKPNRYARAREEGVDLVVEVSRFLVVICGCRCDVVVRVASDSSGN